MSDTGESFKEELPEVSVIVPVRNEEKTIANTINSVLRLDYPHYEVILVDGGSQDQTISIMEKTRDISQQPQNRLRIIKTNDSTPSQGRNIGVRNSSSDMVAFIDGDCHIIGKNWLREGVLLLQQKEVGGVCGPILSCSHGTYLSKAFWDVLLTFFASGGSTLTARHKDQREVKNLPSGNAIYRREAIEKVGLFSEDLRFCEDIDLSYRIRRAGYRLLFSPKMRVEHDWKVNSFSSIFWHMLRYGSGRATASKKYHYLFSPFYAIPSVALVGLLMLFSLSFLYGGPLIYVTISLILLYVAICFISAFLAAYQFRNLTMIVIAPLTYVIVHLGYAIGFIWGLIKKR